MAQPNKRTHVEDWLRVHRRLIDMENAFTDLAIKVAAGQASSGELAKARSELMATRELCTAIYEKAFPKPAQP